MDWLSRLLDIVPVSGRLEIRCLYAAPWRLVQQQSGPGEIPYHIVVEGSAILEDPAGGPPKRLKTGDMLLLPHGRAHTLHDGSGAPADPAQSKVSLNLVIDRNNGTGDSLDMLCGRFILTPPHDRLLS